jgi:hypothetical protein
MKNILLAAALLVASTVVALAQPVCGDREYIVGKLAEDYAERLVSSGMHWGEEALLEIWAYESTASFTILLTSPQGVSCVVAGGTDFFIRDPATAQLGEES